MRRDPDNRSRSASADRSQGRGRRRPTRPPSARTATQTCKHAFTQHHATLTQPALDGWNFKTIEIPTFAGRQPFSRIKLAKVLIQRPHWGVYARSRHALATRVLFDRHKNSIGN